jgi:hypothetical protein
MRDQRFDTIRLGHFTVSSTGVFLLHYPSTKFMSANSVNDSHIPGGSLCNALSQVQISSDWYELMHLLVLILLVYC